MHYFLLHCSLLHCFLFNCSLLHCSLLQCSLLHCSLLHYSLMHCILLHCIMCCPTATQLQRPALCALCSVIWLQWFSKPIHVEYECWISIYIEIKDFQEKISECCWQNNIMLVMRSRPIMRFVVRIGSCQRIGSNNLAS